MKDEDLIPHKVWNEQARGDKDTYLGPERPAGLLRPGTALYNKR